MGFLDELFGSKDGQQQGSGVSPLTLGLLALLAYRVYQNRNRGTEGTPGSVPAPQDTPIMDPSSPGSLGDILGGLLGGQSGTSSGRQNDGRPQAGGLGDLLRGGLGGLLGGAAVGPLLNGGLGHLLEQLQRAGHGEVASSWIGTGANRQIDPNALESALGRDTIDTLSRQTGRPYDEVLSELSQSLPETIDKMTPDGRLPTGSEGGRWV